jgi:hypothetical protein
MSTEPDAFAPQEECEEVKERTTLRVLGWVSVGMPVAALGIFLGAGLRSRYKFKRRTPYDFYANSGEHHANEFGMGI